MQNALRIFALICVAYLGRAGTVTNNREIRCDMGSADVSNFSAIDEALSCALPGPDAFPGTFDAVSNLGHTGIGVLGLDIRTQISGPLSSIGFAGGDAVLSYQDTYIFSGPAPTVTTSMSLILAGSIDFDCARCDHELDVEFMLTDESFHFTAKGQYFQTIVSSLVTVPTGVPIPIGIGLDGDASTGECPSGGCPGTLFSDVNFIDTLSFNPNGPLFNLPDGFTVNGACVVDNNFVCGESATAPEPGAFMLGGLGLVAVGLLRKRRTRSGGIAQTAVEPGSRKGPDPLD